MSAIAEQLYATLKTLDARAASSLEKLVRDALELVETQNGGSRPGPLPPDFFARIAAECRIQGAWSRPRPPHAA